MIEGLMQNLEVSLQNRAQQPKVGNAGAGKSFAEVMGNKLKEVRGNKATQGQPQERSVEEQKATTQKTAAKQETSEAKELEAETPLADEEKQDESTVSESAIQLLTQEVIQMLQQLAQNPETKALAEEITGQLLAADLEGTTSLEGLLESLNQLLAADLPEEHIQTMELLNQLGLEVMGEEEAKAFMKELKIALDENVPVDEKARITVEAQTQKGQENLIADVADKVQSDSALPEQTFTQETAPVEEPVAAASEKNTAKNSEESIAKGMLEEAPELKEVNQNLHGTAQVNLGAKAEAALDEIKGENVQIEAREIIEQIVNRAEISLKEGKSEIKLQLMPENLGSVFVKISMEKGSMSAKVYAENLQVKELIDNNLNQLRINLGEKGINVSSLEVSVGQDPHDFHRQQTYYQHQSKLKRLTNERINQRVMGVMYQESSQPLNPYVIESNFDGLA